MTIIEQLSIIKRGTVDLITATEIELRLKEYHINHKPLRVKYGCDPSAPDIHLGHTVVLKKLRTFQELGHKVIFIIGDFTARIGDPTGRSATRPPLTEEEVNKNANTYQEQVFKILHRDKTEVVFNSDWLRKMSPPEIIELAASYTVARMLERNDFKERFAKNIPIRIHEFLYPLLQGFDSIAINSDIEIGGSDQLFNILVGRELQKDRNLQPQIAITMPLLEGLDGKEKMSKSLNNYVGVTDSPQEMFGKIMSIPDSLIVKYFTLLTNRSTEEIKEIEQEIEKGIVNPKDIKVLLGSDIVEFFYDKENARFAQKEFEKVFSKKELPTEIESYTIKPNQLNSEGKIRIIDLLTICKSANTLSEARRLIRQKGVDLNNKALTDELEYVKIADGQILKVGKKKFLKLKI